MREWKRDIEAVGNITRLHSKILSQATNLKSIKLDDTSAATSFELDLNIKDLKIDPYSIALSEVQDSFKYVIENILKEAREEKSESAYSSKQDSLEPKAIKGITNIDGKACINFKELDSKHQSKIIAICLKESTFENLKEIFEELKLEKEVLRDYASVICDSYSSVVSAEDAKEFKQLIFAKKDESKLLTESKVEHRALTREKSFSKSNERKAQLEEQITIVKEQSAQHDEKLEEIAGRISNRLSLIKENTTLDSSSVLMGERTIQLNINYETLRKHAGHDTYKYYLQDITEKSTIIHCKAYADLILLARDASGEIVKERDSTEESRKIAGAQKPISNSSKATNKLNRKIQKALASIDSYIFDNKELLELKRSDLAESQKCLSDLKQEQELKENFVETLLPHYLGRIYEQSGTDILAVWNRFKVLNPNADVQKLSDHIQSNPSHLGKLAGIGLGTVFGVSASRRKAIEQVSKLGQQLLKYEESMARLKEIKEDDLIKEQEQIIKVLEKELKDLEYLKPSKAEAKFLSSLKIMQAGSGLNMGSFKSVIESDEVQDLICEYYNSQNEKYTRLNAIDEEYQDEYQAYSKEQEQQAAENQEKAVKVHSTTRSNSSNRRKERTKVPSLRFKDVQDALTSSDIERIFKDYASSIRGSLGAIKRSGSEISMGSLSMNLSKGTWIRHSSGKKSNIFGFVAEGACVSKRQSLEIVAELSGICAESSSYDYRAHVASSRANKEKMQEQTQQKQANEWIVAQDKINNADIFDPHKHLKGSWKHNTLEAVYAYKDAEGKLLGYVVRFVSKEDGKKQTLPVTYCYNAVKDEQAWRLKGFTDKGDKPIFGIEKAICSSKPILIVEGEKATIAAAKILPDYSVISWMGGSNAADKVNWNQLQWRDVIIWPDNDKAGFKAAEVIKDKINKANDHIGFVSVVDPTTLKFNGSVHKDLLPEKWDLADRLPEGMTIANVKEVIENVRAAHLDMQQIQSVIQNANFKLTELLAEEPRNAVGKEASPVSHQLLERNVWQEVFKGKIVNEVKITALSAHEHRAATFFRSEEASNYVKYLEATGKGGVAHDYLKFDSPMYQDLLTSLATRDERLSENIKSLGNSNNTADISTDTVTIEAKTKLIDDAQSLYEKKALDYGGIAGPHAVYRDHLELMVKNYNESHGKVTLYKDIVRDVSILHSAQLSMNIHDLSDSHHKEIAGAIYNNVTSYKASNGRGQSEHNIDNLDKIKIATNCYEQLCSSKAWSIKAKAHLNESLAILERRAELQRDIENDNVASKLEREKFKLHQEQIKHEILVSNTVSDVFAALEKDQKYFVDLNGNIKYEIFNSQFQELAEQAFEHQAKQLLPQLKDVVAAVERNNVFATADILAQLKDSKDLEATYKHFDSSLERHQLETQHQNIRQDKVDAKTTDEMLTAISREHEFFKSLDGNIQYRQTNDQYINYSQQAIEHEERALLPKLKDVVLAVERNNVFSTQDILAQLKGSKDLEETYKHFDSSLERHQLETKHQAIREEKENAKTTDEMLTAISREHEFFKSLDGKLKYAARYDSSILSTISNAKTIEQDTLITNMHNMVVYAKKHGILNDQEILNQFASNDSRNVLKNLSKTCEKHYIDHHNENIKHLLDDEYVMVGTKKYTCPIKYMKHEMQNNIPSFVDEKQIATTFAKVKAEIKELRLERELEHTMTMRF